MCEAASWAAPRPARRRRAAGLWATRWRRSQASSPRRRRRRCPRTHWDLTDALSAFLTKIYILKKLAWMWITRAWLALPSRAALTWPGPPLAGRTEEARERLRYLTWELIKVSPFPEKEERGKTNCRFSSAAALNWFLIHRRLEGSLYYINRSLP